MNCTHYRFLCVETHNYFLILTGIFTIIALISVIVIVTEILLSNYRPSHVGQIKTTRPSNIWEKSKRGEEITGSKTNSISNLDAPALHNVPQALY